MILTYKYIYIFIYIYTCRNLDVYQWFHQNHWDNIEIGGLYSVQSSFADVPVVASPKGHWKLWQSRCMKHLQESPSYPLNSSMGDLK